MIGIEPSALYADYRERVSAYVGSRIHHVHDAEDVVSAVFLKLCTGIESYDPGKASLSTWVYRVTHNAVCDYYRARQRRGEPVDLEDCPFLEAPLPEEEPDEDELEALASALESLLPRERDVIILRFYKGYSPAQVAEAIGISHQNAKYIQHTAIQKLRRAMNAATV